MLILFLFVAILHSTILHYTWLCGLVVEQCWARPSIITSVDKTICNLRSSPQVGWFMINPMNTYSLAKGKLGQEFSRFYRKTETSRNIQKHPETSRNQYLQLFRCEVAMFQSPHARPAQSRRWYQRFDDRAPGRLHPRSTQSTPQKLCKKIPGFQSSMVFPRVFSVFFLFRSRGLIAFQFQGTGTTR